MIKAKLTSVQACPLSALLHLEELAGQDEARSWSDSQEEADERDCSLSSLDLH